MKNNQQDTEQALLEAQQALVTSNRLTVVIAAGLAFALATALLIAFPPAGVATLFATWFTGVGTALATITGVGLFSALAATVGFKIKDWFKSSPSQSTHGTTSGLMSAMPFAKDSKKKDVVRIWFARSLLLSMLEKNTSRLIDKINNIVLPMLKEKYPNKQFELAMNPRPAKHFWQSYQAEVCILPFGINSGRINDDFKTYICRAEPLANQHIIITGFEARNLESMQDNCKEILNIAGLSERATLIQAYASGEMWNYPENFDKKLAQALETALIKVGLLPKAQAPASVATSKSTTFAVSSTVADRGVATASDLRQTLSV